MKKLLIALTLLLTVPAVVAQPKNKTTMKKEVKKQTAGRDRLGTFAPKFAELNDDVLFGQVWSREGELSPRDRSTITIATLIGSGAPEFTLKAHLTEGKKNGISKNEIAEMITHIAFYAGWPKAWGAFNAAKEVYADEIAADPTGSNAGYIFGVGVPNEAYQQYFTGKSWLNSLVSPDKSNTINVSNVTFEPGCINHWHKHTTEQILLVTEGTGWYQEWGKPAQELHKGDVVVVPKGVKHWHGASANSWFAHLSVMDTAKEKTEWQEPVNPKEYAKLR
ncbi:gamma-carboxymuconolactone decarboxylase [Capnocytophaga sp. HP1101]